MINAAQSGRFRIGGAFDVNRLGFGAMRIVGRGVWGPPEDRAEALKTLRRLPDLGVDFIDTADSYGPDFSEELIREALAPLRQDPCRDQGRARAHRPEHLDSARPAGISDPAGAQEPLAARRRDDRSRGNCIASIRRCRRTSSSTRSATLIKDKVIRCAGLSEVERRGNRGGVEGLPGRHGAEPL